MSIERATEERLYGQFAETRCAERGRQVRVYAVLDRGNIQIECEVRP